jgi:hypothetical protein
MRKRFTDDEYAVLVLQNMKRAMKRSDYLLAFIPPRDLMRDTAEVAEVTSAIQRGIDVLRERLMGPDRDED